MEDRYLYKAKRKDNGEWVIGNLVCSVYTRNDVCVGQYGSKVGMHEVDPSTICQCAGLKDENDNLIWENDIVKTQVGTAKVVWDKSEWRIEWLKNDLWRKDLYYWAVEDIQRLEVIGNIFDNAELLESEEK